MKEITTPVVGCLSPASPEAGYLPRPPRHSERYSAWLPSTWTGIYPPPPLGKAFTSNHRLWQARLPAVATRLGNYLVAWSVEVHRLGICLGGKPIGMGEYRVYACINVYIYTCIHQNRQQKKSRQSLRLSAVVVILLLSHSAY